MHVKNKSNKTQSDGKQTRMTTFIKTKFKYRLAANITVHHIISKLILQRIIITNFCGPESHLRKVQYRIWNPKSKKKSFKSVQKQRNYALTKDAQIVMFKMDIQTFMYSV